MHLEAESNWHTMSVDEIERSFGTNTKGLLSQTVDERRARFGRNELPSIQRPGILTTLAHQFSSPLVVILIFAGITTFILREYVDAFAIAAVVLINATIGYAQERRAEHSVRSLMGLLVQRCRVIRDGEEVELESVEIVPGDLVLLESGVRVPADIRLIRVQSLLADESLLTGESVPVSKDTSLLSREVPVADRANMAFAGTTVTSGRGRGYAVGTGLQTQIGAIATEMREIDRSPAPLERRLGRFARAVGAVVIISAIAGFAVGVAIGEPASEMFKTAVALAVATIPEGLTVAFTITMVVGVRRMAARKVIVRSMPSVETLGSTTVIGSDKTGTLTLNQMVVSEIWSACGSIDLTKTTPKTCAQSKPVELTLIAGVLANEARISLHESEYQTHGDPTEVALLNSAVLCGLSPVKIRGEYRSYSEIPFESERQFSASVREQSEGYVTFVKGAPERILSMSTSALTTTGEIPIDRESVHDVAISMASRGLRVLAMAYLPRHERPESSHALQDPEGLVFLGLQAMSDPVRRGAKDAIAACRSAGIRVVMITGDHVETAKAVASELGLNGGPDSVMTGPELSKCDETELRRAVRHISVYARVAPEQKLGIVRALQAQGEIVAITGDGVNDAPALRAADIGIAMGNRGTDVAKEAADMVLVDDNFVSIVAAVEEGRATLANVRNAAFFLLSTNGGELLTILIALGLGWELPLIAVQILWLNLVTDSIQAIGLSFEPGFPGAMKQNPKPLNEGLLPRVLWERVGLSGMLMAAMTLVLFWREREHGGSLETARTMVLTTMVLFQTFQVANARSADRSVFSLNPLKNPVLLVGSAMALLIHALALYVSPTQYILRVAPIGLGSWLVCSAFAATILFAVELHKLWHRHNNRRSSTSAQ